MTSPQPDGQSNRPAALDAESPIDASVMEKVLQETLSAASAEQPMDAAEFALFQEVVGRHAGQPLSSSPIVTELVQAILLYRFGEPIRRTREWETMPREIADILWESPHSHDQLQRLWDRLTETKP